MDTVNLVCPRCKCETEHTLAIRPAGVHYADAVCQTCGKKWFPPKPDADPTKYKRPNSHRDLVRKYSPGYCEMCLCPANDLPKGQTLEAQHVKEFKDGGSERRENIWIICTGCHRLIHWVRTYRLAPEHRESVQDVAEKVTSWRGA